MHESVLSLSSFLLSSTFSLPQNAEFGGKFGEATLVSIVFKLLFSNKTKQTTHEVPERGKQT